MTTPRGVILLSHAHIDLLNTVNQTAMLHALPLETAQVPRELTPIVESERSQDVSRLNWSTLQARQARLFREVVRPKLDQHPDYDLAYFGATYIPLAIDLGYRVGGFRPHTPYLLHHRRKTWHWPGRDGAAPPIRMDGMPWQASDEAGDAIIRIATSFGIRNQDVRAVVPDPIADIYIHLGDHLGRDALHTPDELGDVVDKFCEAIDKLHTLRPNTQRIHLFTSGPVGLAFQLGTAIPPTNQPPIVTWKFTRTARPAYRRALVIGQTKGTADQAAPEGEILFLTTGAPSQDMLRFDKEHSEIARRLKAAESPIRLQTHMAVETSDLQPTLRQSQASVVHLSSHGSPDGTLHVEGAGRVDNEIRRRDTVTLFQLANADGRIQCVVFNSCHSAPLAEALTAAGVVPFAIGMSSSILDQAAILFAQGFYGALAEKQGLTTAFQYGKNRIAMGVLTSRNASFPQLFVAPGVNPEEVLFP